MIENSRVRRSIQLTLSSFALAAIFASSAMALVPPPATRYVAPAPVGSDIGNICVISATPCATIQHAVDETVANSTIEVAAGTYEESQILVDKPLSLFGAGAGQTIVDGTATGQAKDGLLRFDSPAVGDIAVGGFTFKGANGENADGEAVAMRFSEIPAGSQVTVSNNVLLTNETLDPALGEDWSLGIYVSNSAAEFEIQENLFEGMWQGILAEKSTGPKNLAHNEFANLVANDDGVDIWPGEGILLLAVGHNGGEGEQVSSLQEVFGNSFHGYAGLGVAVQSGHHSATPSTPNSFSDVVVSGNDIDLAGATFPETGRPLAGVVLKTRPGSTIEDAAVVGNTISVTAPGNDIGLEGGVSDAVVQGNRLSGSPVAGLDTFVATGPVDAIDNWWGCNAGPSAPGCVTQVGEADNSPNLVLTGSASASQLQPGETATIEASLLRDSDGNTVASVPWGGQPVAFAAGLGTLAPSSAPLNQGVASSTFTAGSQPGDAGVTVGLDGEKVAVPLTVAGPAKADPVPQPKPPVAEPPSIKPSGAGSPKPVPGNGQLKVAVVTCPAGTCEVAVKEPKAKIGGKSYRIRVKAPGRLGAGGSAAIKVILPKAARDALKQTGRGRITLKITVTSSTGATKTITVRIKLVAKKR
jgi:hypothetical protein